MRRESGIFRKSIVVLFVGMALFLSCGLSSSWAADLVAETGIKAVSTDWSVYDNIYINDGVTVTLAPGAHDLGAANLIIEEGGSVECAPLIANSQTSVSVGTGSKTFTVEAGLGFLAGQEVIINNRDARSQLLTMDGVVTSYASGSLIVDVSSASGSGAHGSWTIALKPSVIITTIGNIIINNGGMITALGMGYQGERGWQGYSEIYIAPYGLAPPTQMSGLYGSGGGGHGGRGGDGGYAQGGEPVYGSQSNPTTLGSGGGGGGLNTSNTWSEGGAGGGAIKLNVYGSLINNGIITSDGGQGHRVSTSELQYYPAAGGAGGSIWINTGALLGSGVISAKGGSAFGGGGTSSHVAGGGGGGRIACYYSNGGDSMTYNVSGGASSPNSNKPVASEGTVHIVHKEDYTITYLNQYQSNGKTKIDIGGLSDSQSAVFKLVMIASSSQKLTPQVEVKEVGVDFDGEGITSGFPVVYDGINPAVGIVNYTGLKFHPSTPLAYHWRARIKYADGSFSDWVSFGDNEESVADIKGAIGTNITADETWVTDKTYTNLYIGNNAKITIDSANKTGGAGQIVLTVDNLWVDSGSSISADAKGYRGGTYGSSSQYSEGLSALGTGRSLWSGNGSGGAGYGGTGGLSGQNSAGGITYGSITAPVDLGSGAGAAPASFGGAGGGAIKIIASGNITNNGIITVNGGGGTSPEATRGAGGGSGGSIWVITDRLDGSGIFSAKGGNGGESSEPTSYSGGGGGGGRISLNVANTDRFIGDIIVEPGDGGQGGAGGTIYRPVSLSPASVTLIRDIVWNHGEHTFANLIIPPGITLSAGIGTGRTWAHAVHGQTAYPSAGGGGIPSGWAYASGAGHGGVGGLTGAYVGGEAYDTESAPIYYGSSGASGHNILGGGYGGGAIKLTLTEALTINGTISANGQNGAASSGISSSGGSGGSIWLNAASILGTGGVITATGGAGGAGSISWGFASGGGAGGRIAVTSPNEDDVYWRVSSMSFSANGGAAGACSGCSQTPKAQDGGNGTLYGIGPMATIINPNPMIPTFHKKSFTIQGEAFSPASTLTGVQILIKNETLGKYWNGSSWVDSESSWQNVTQVSGWESWSYPSPAFPANTSYSYSITVLAKDEIFPSGGPVHATANFVYDTVAPVISSVVLNPSSGYRKLGDTVTITVTPSAAEPNNGLLTPSAITFNGQSITLSPSSSNTGPFTGTYTVTQGHANITNPSATGVTLTDSAGNVSSTASSAESTLVIDAHKPVITSVALSPSSGMRKIGDKVTITATVEHNEENLSGAAKVLSSSTATFNGQSVAVASGPTGASSPYTFTYIYTVGEGDGDTVNAEATNIVITDASGNASESGSSSGNSIIIDSTKPAVSDAHISISSSPANGTVYLVGETVTARWDNSASGDNNSDISSVTCDFSALGGSSAVAMSASNGIYTASYIIATNSITGTHNISVTAVDTAGNQRVTIDPAQITIASGSLTLTSPNTAVSYISGTTQQITWTAGGDVSRVNLKYSTDSGQSYKIINTVGSLTGSNSYAWVVPSDITSKARVKVEDAAVEQVYSVSSVDFSIVYPSITITSPDGGESWAAGSTQNITWTTDSSLVTHVKLEYSVDGGLNWNLIAAAAPNTGSYSWILDNLFAVDTVRLRATGISRNQALTLGGTASGKVSASGWLEDNYKVLVLDVLSDFSAGDTLVISGLKFDSFTASPADSLRLSVGSGYAIDDKKITVMAPSVYQGGAGDGWSYAESE